MEATWLIWRWLRSITRPVYGKRRTSSVYSLLPHITPASSMHVRLYAILSGDNEAFIFFFIMIIIEKSFVTWSIPKKLIITCKWSNFVSMTTRNEDSMIRNSVFFLKGWVYECLTGGWHLGVNIVRLLPWCALAVVFQEAIRLVSLPLGDSMVSRTKDKKTVTQLQETWALVWLLAVQFQWWASSRCFNTFID